MKNVSNSERARKLFEKLETYDVQQAELVRKREEVQAELAALIGLNTGTTKTVPYTPEKKEKGALGNKIVQYLMKDNGQDISTIARKLNKKPNAIGLSLHHLGVAGKVRMEDSKYYTTGESTGEISTAAEPATT